MPKYTNPINVAPCKVVGSGTKVTRTDLLSHQMVPQVQVLIACIWLVQCLVD